LNVRTIEKKSKLAYVTHHNAADIGSWSGTVYYIREALRASGFRIENIDKLRDTYGLLSKTKKLVYMQLLSKRYLRDRETLTLKSYASQVEKALASTDCDVVFCPGTIPVAYVRTEKPIVFWSDSTFAGVLNFYPEFSNLCNKTVRNGHRTEQHALSTCRLAIFSSEWAAHTAIQYYDVDPQKIKVVPFGANTRCHHSAAKIRGAIENKQFDTCKLLFIGVDWFRKGGDIALAVAEKLNRQGLYTELHIVGCRPPHEVPSFVKLHGYVSKKTETGRRELNRLFRESHFLIVPSRAECFGVVYAEASSFGLPSLATNVGGIPTAIHQDKNGRTFPLDENPEQYSDHILGLMGSWQAYTNLALSSFHEYSERLNWSSSGKKVRELVSRYCI